MRNTLKRIGTLLKWVIAFAVIALLLLLSANNQQSVAVSLLPFPFEARMPLFMLAVLAFCAGMLIGGIAISFKHMRRTRETHRLRHRMVALENEVAGLKHEAKRAASLPPAA